MMTSLQKSIIDKIIYNKRLSYREGKYLLGICNQSNLSFSEQRFVNKISNLKNRLNFAKVIYSNRKLLDILSLNQEDQIITLPSGDTDLFVIVGQSNAVGQGDSASSPSVTNGSIEMETDGTIAAGALSDPVGDANTGSAWPAFANEWFQLTGRKAAIVETAGSGTGLISGSAEWGPSGALRGNAKDAANACITTLEANSSYDLGGVYYIWIQGENESQATDDSSVTGDLYKAALKSLVDYFEANTTQFNGFVCVPTQGVTPRGNRTTIDAAHLVDHNNSSGTYGVLGWMEIRKAHYEAIAEDEDIYPGYFGTHQLIGRGTSYMEDALHYSQTSLNIIGTQTAKQFYNHLTKPELSSPYLGVETFVSPAGNTGDRTVSHTTEANTNFLAVIACMSDQNNSGGTQEMDGISFNGQEMTLAGWCRVRDGGVALGAVVLQIWYINDEDYGSSLSSVTGDIIADFAGSVTNNIHLVAVNANGPYRPDMIGCIMDGDKGTDTSSHDIYTGLNSLVITAFGYNDAGTTPRTGTLSGSTEIADIGVASSVTNNWSGLIVGQTTSNANTDNTMTVTLSDSSNEITGLSVAFRAKIEGEDE